MNNKHIQNTLIFNKKLNDKFNIIPLNTINNTQGPMKYFPPAIKEWYNSVYSYNKSSIKNLSIADKNLGKLINSYFSLYFKRIISKSTSISIRSRRLIMNKVFVSKAGIKHTSSKIFITLYVYNQERRNLIKKIRVLEKLLFSKKKLHNESLSLEEKLSMIANNKKNVLIANWESKLQLSLLKLIETNKDIVSIARDLELEKIKRLILKNQNNLLEYLKYFTVFYKESYNLYDNYEERIYKINLEKEIVMIAYYKLLLNLNKFKFEDKFITKLKSLISKIYHKKVEFNIINLKTLYFNSDIFTRIIALKLKNRDNSLLRVLKTSLSLVDISKINTIKERSNKYNIKELWINKVRNLNINSIINKLYALPYNVNKDILNQMFLDIFPNSLFFKKDVIKVLDINEDDRLSKFVLDMLKYKKIGGVRLEAKGRLTRRFTASRSVFKVKWKGSLKNVDSSYKGIPSIILRGHLKSNVQYSMINSKTRNGAFGLKGWISSK